MVEKHKKYSDSDRFGRVWLGKRADSEIWYLKYRLPQTGKTRERSTGTTSKKDALRLADITNGQLFNQRMGTADGTTQIDSLFQQFIDAKTGRVKPKTVKRLETTIASFKTWLASHHPECIQARHLTANIVRQFQADRKVSGLSLRSVNNDVMNLHTIFLWGIREGLVAKSPADYSRKGNIDRFKVPKSPKDVYTEAEVLALIAQAEKDGDLLTRDLIIVFAGTGMRFEELAHLKPTCLFWDGPTPLIDIRAQKGWEPKDPTEQKRIPMLPEVEEVMRRRCADCLSVDEYVFKNKVGGKVHVNRSRERLQRLFPKVGIDSKRRLHWHSFRNYFIIQCLSKGVAVNAVMSWTGHDSASMVLHYAKAIRLETTLTEFRKLTEVRGKSGEQDLQVAEKS